MITRAAERNVVARSGGMCELCGARIVEDDKLMGEIAHIRGSRPGSARYGPGMSESQRDSPENLILLCPTCHTRIDKHPEKYTAAHLRDRRQIHADKLERAVGIAMPDIEFPEIDGAVRHIASTDIPSEQSYVLVPPREKIQKNRLSAR